MRRALLRGSLAGALFSGCHYALELAGTFAVLQWTGIGEVLRSVTLELVLLLVQYLVFGALLGMTLTPPAAFVRSLLPARARGAWLDFLALALAFVAFTYLWNDDSVLLRSIYVLTVVVTLVVVALLALVRRLWRRLPAIRLPWPAPRVAYAAGAVAVLAALGAGGLSLARPGSRPPGRSTPDGPNVVLIVVDTLRPDHLGAYGYRRPTSPAIDRIAAEGVVYENAFAPAPWTLPSHASLFTGLHSSRHQAYYGQERLARDKQTLADLLSSSGYRTAGFSANPWVGEPTGLDQGFQTFEYTGSSVITDTLFLELVKKKSRRADLGGARTTARLIGWTAAREPGERFFAFANFMEVHEPYGTVPDPYFSLFLDSPLRRGVGRLWVRETALFVCRGCNPADHPDLSGVRCVDDRWRVEGQRLRDTIALYDAGVRYVDHQIGLVYQELQRAGILDDTLVIVTSDHGEFLGEHGRIGHGVHLSDPVLRVPLIVRYPARFPRGVRVRRDVSLVDVFPTVSAVAGVEAAPGPDAVSLLPSELPAPSPRPILAEHYPLDAATLRNLGRQQRCDYREAGYTRASLRVGRLKYVWSSGEAPELYDVDADPLERRNIAESMPRQRAELDLQLQAWRQSAREAPASVAAPIDAVTRKRLESLGYVR